jgi:Uroporphyrinogen decarboxylase (URO-D)
MPRSIIRALVRGQPPARQLFIPLIFTLAAKLEDIPLPTFLTNPTKIANALTAIHQRLHTDGVVGYFDLTLVAEALGCQLDWRRAPPVIKAPRIEAMLGNIQLSSNELKNRGRIPVALEVVQRLNMMLRDRPALLVGLPGPLCLAQQLFGKAFADQLASGESVAVDILDTLSEMILHLALAFCLVGAHLLVIDEEVVPPTALQLWQSAMAALWNAIRFHEALPLLCADSDTQSRDLIGTPLICLTAPPDDVSPLPERPFALALPTAESQLKHITRWTSSKHCVLITTDGEIPYQTEIQSLQRRITAMRSILVHGTKEHR